MLFVSSIALSQSGWIVHQTGVNSTLWDIYFVNENTGWIVGDTTAVFKSTNGGLNWTKQDISYITDTELYSVKFLNENTGFAAGGHHSGYYDFYYAYIFKTTNGGTYWNIHYNNQGGSYWLFNEILLIDEDTIFATAEGTTGFVSTGGVYKSTNGGLNFTSTFPNIQSHSLSFINSQTGWATGFYWNDVGTKIIYIYKTTNTGMNWNQQYRDSNYNAVRIRKIQFLNENTGYAVGGYNSTIFYKTTNGGVNWDTTYYPNRKNETLLFLDENTGWKAGCAIPDSSCVAYTSNGGASWILQRRGVIARVYSLYFINNLTGWAAMWDGTIMKTTTGGFVSVSNLGNEIPSNYKLHQNYPNPFNPVTNIRFDIPRSSHVKLIIYDALGREIATLVNEKLSAGSYESEWNASSYPSGVYFYTLFTKNYSESKKMLLIK
jgi:photosystem II stability/assembly factor-like uncharacterized protein